LNSASAGFAKIPVRLAVKYLQNQQSNNVDKFGDDACFILNSRKKGTFRYSEPALEIQATFDSKNDLKNGGKRGKTRNIASILKTGNEARWI